MSSANRIRANLAAGRRGLPKVIEAHETLGIRDCEIAKDIGVSPVTVSNYRRGVQDIPPPIHAALVEHLRRSHADAVQALGEALIQFGHKPSLDVYRLKVARAAVILKELVAEAAEKETKP